MRAAELEAAARDTLLAQCSVLLSLEDPGARRLHLPQLRLCRQPFTLRQARHTWRPIQRPAPA